MRRQCSSKRSRLVDGVGQETRVLQAKIEERAKGGSGEGAEVGATGSDGGGAREEDEVHEVDAQADADDDADADADADADEDAEADAAAARGASVARSVRSMRSASRKQVCLPSRCSMIPCRLFLSLQTKRSLSMSSAGTTTTTTTRASRKRQKNSYNISSTTSTVEPFCLFKDIF